MRLPFPLALFSSLAFVACGSRVVVDAGGGGTTGSASSTGGASDTCPSAPPSPSTPCAVPSAESCFYGDMCCPDVYVCNGDAWQAIAVECLPPAVCPPSPPADGDPCVVCIQQSPCAWNECGTGQGLVTAACTQAGTWSVSAAPCPPPVACGGTPCKPGEVCLETEGGAGISFACVPDPCAPMPLSCTCAGALCGGPPFACDTMDGVVDCSCSTCP